jgi:hypothetical protein
MKHGMLIISVFDWLVSTCLRSHNSGDLHLARGRKLVPFCQSSLSLTKGEHVIRARCSHSRWPFQFWLLLLNPALFYLFISGVFVPWLRPNTWKWSNWVYQGTFKWESVKVLLSALCFCYAYLPHFITCRCLPHLLSHEVIQSPPDPASWDAKSQTFSDPSLTVSPNHLEVGP